MRSQLHHYVPQFYLRRFADKVGRIWLWDRERDLTFNSTPKRVAARHNFYYLTEFARLGYDPHTMEKQFSDLEGQIALIIDNWLTLLGKMHPGELLPIPETNRQIISLFLAVQMLRTEEAREILKAFIISLQNRSAISEEEMQLCHLNLLWDEETIANLTERFSSSIWIFGRNNTRIPFVTSDNPITFRTENNRQWLKIWPTEQGVYAAFPLAPEIILFCYPREKKWKQFSSYDGCLSPIAFTEELVESENSGQVFMATRFLISPRADFRAERIFAKTIGTDTYA